MARIFTGSLGGLAFLASANMAMAQATLPGSVRQCSGAAAAALTFQQTVGQDGNVLSGQVMAGAYKSIVSSDPPACSIGVGEYRFNPAKNQVHRRRYQHACRTMTDEFVYSVAPGSDVMPNQITFYRESNLFIATATEPQTFWFEASPAEYITGFYRVNEPDVLRTSRYGAAIADGSPVTFGQSVYNVPRNVLGQNQWVVVFDTSRVPPCQEIRIRALRANSTSGIINAYEEGVWELNSARSCGTPCNVPPPPPPAPKFENHVCSAASIPTQAPLKFRGVPTALYTGDLVFGTTTAGSYQDEITSDPPQCSLGSLEIRFTTGDTQIHRRRKQEKCRTMSDAFVFVPTPQPQASMVMPGRVTFYRESNSFVATATEPQTFWFEASPAEYITATYVVNVPNALLTSRYGAPIANGSPVTFGQSVYSVPRRVIGQNEWAVVFDLRKIPNPTTVRIRALRANSTSGINNLYEEGVWEVGPAMRCDFQTPPPPPPTAPNPVTVTYVLKYSDGNPISKVAVKVYDETGNLVTTLFTDADGKITLTSTPGKYTLEPVFPVNKAPSPPDNKVSITTAQGQPDTVVSFKLPPPSTGTITIVVYGIDGNPAPNTPVEIYNEAGVLIDTKTTDANGKITITVPPGKYTVVPIYPDGQKPNPPDDKFVVTVVAGPNQQYTARPPVQQKGTIQGSVFNDKNRDNKVDGGEGIANTPITLTQGGQPIRPEIRTDSNGFYQFSSLPAGTYVVTIGTIPGFNLPASFSRTKTITVVPGTTSTFDFKILTAPPPAPAPTTASLTVVVYGIDGNPAPNTPVEIYDEAGVLIDTPTTDADGKITIVVPLGKYTLVPIYPDGQKPNPPNDKFVVTVVAGPNQQYTARPPVQQKGTIQGSVFNDKNSDNKVGGGEGIANTPITLTQGGQPIRPGIRTDSSGFYQFSSLPAGTYVVTIGTIPGFNIPASVSRTKTITIGPGTTSTFDFRILSAPPPAPAPTTGKVEGRVFVDSNKNKAFDSGEDLIPSIPIKLLAADGTVINSATTNQNGGFSFPNVPAGTYTITADLSSRTDVSSTEPSAQFSIRGGGKMVLDFAIEPPENVDYTASGDFTDEFSDFGTNY